MIPACSGCKHEVVLAGKNFTFTFDNETSAEDVWLETLSMYRRIFLLCSQSEKNLGIHPSFGIASPRDFEGSRLGRFANDERIQLLSHRAIS